ncbi:formate dehydrogenase accessory sulfurtransferase FdhD [Aquabacterium sp.]|uniref:formate dehydrogenase accessory sulfurtransferase FdhD n=1 Tax=Aquabacterium sp. TaxID=1872578 RepID=UPI002488180B|nr:formate dehydrogenase accessory sulfurtransferase FdhD [Aquabacterium sp.]MDI1349782.1 formate dehydrogenase accessory sulfurtransferase FdhD [Aquabacterium sp.]
MKLGSPLQPPAGARAVHVTEHRGRDGALHRSDWLAEEVPVALVFNGISHAVMMASPQDLEDFALGFGLTEGLLLSPDELHGVEVLPVGDDPHMAQGIEVQMTVSSACAWRLKGRRRSLEGRTGCGLCGTDSLADACRAVPTPEPRSVKPDALARAMAHLRDWQPLQQLTGATHAAAFCDLNGAVQLVREDVGRHNALDKLVGAIVRARLAPDTGFIAISSRASYEMVHKTAMAGVSVLAAVSAPTARAVDTALAAGIALAGFVRGQDCVAYTHPERLHLERLGLHTP